MRLIVINDTSKWSNLNLHGKTWLQRIILVAEGDNQFELWALLGRHGNWKKRSWH